MVFLDDLVVPFFGNPHIHMHMPCHIYGGFHGESSKFRNVSSVLQNIKSAGVHASLVDCPVLSLASLHIGAAPPLLVTIWDICYLQEQKELRKPMDTL